MLNLKRFSLAAVIIASAIMCASPSVGALSTGGIGGRPANPDASNPRTQSIFIFTANKSETKSDVILVSNNSDQSQTVELYAVDGIVTNTGSFTCSQQAEARQSVGAWTTLKKNSVTLDPGKSEEVGFDLTVPASADVGEHNGCIVFQVAGDKGEASGNVRIVTRQAIRVVATVPGNLQRNIEIARFETANKDDDLSYSLLLKNTGNVSADVDTKVLLTSLFGNVIYENGGGYPVLANQQLDLTFVDESRPILGGWYYASASLTYDNRAGTFGTNDSSHLTKKQTDRQLLFVAPTAAGALIIAVILGFIVGVIAWLVLKRWNRNKALETWGSYTVKSGDNLQSIAENHKISWKKLAAINNIAAPYTLEHGTKIRIPSISKAAKTKI